MSTINRKVIISGMLGNGLEWYDYALYGHMSSVFALLFFPGKDASLSLILTFLTFAAGFVARPLGAVLFGRIGDKVGRKKALVASMILMAVPTGCIGLLPTHAQIGVLAPLLLLFLRVLQGLSLGGAFTGSVSYVVEHSPVDRRGRAGAFTVLSLIIGFLVGSLVSTTVASSMSEADFMSWGWRLPFFVGVLIGFVGFWIRNHGEESPVFKEAKACGAISQSPVKDACLHHPLRMLQAFSIYLFVTIPFYMLAIYMIAYSKNHLGLSQEDALQVNSMAMIAMFLPVWWSAKFSDKHGRKAALMPPILVMLAAVYPAFHLMQQGADFVQVGDIHHAMLYIAGGQCLLAFINGWYISPIPTLLVEMFPTRIRYTGMALSYNFCAILGGLTPAWCEWLIRETGSITSIMYLLVGSGLCSLVALYVYDDRYREPLVA